MRHILLRFNYGVEIGANLAYIGHYNVTKNGRILDIANEEVYHKRICGEILKMYGLKPFWGFNTFFTVVGTVIQKLCYIAPKIMLNWVAQSMETFAVFNYRHLAKLYPPYADILTEMAEAEDDHRIFFKELS